MAGSLKLGLVFTLFDRVTGPMRTVRRSVEGITKSTRAASLAVADFTRSFRVVGAVGAAALGAISVGIFGAVRRFADAGDAALETSQKLGISVPSFMRISHAAKQGGVEAEALADALRFLNLSSAGAARGSKQDAQAFRDLGISFMDAAGQIKPADQLLAEIADKFAEMPNGARQAQIAAALFGKAGTDMIPMLEEGAAGIKHWGDAAVRLGLVMSQEAAENADRFNDSLNTLTGSIFGLSNGIAGGLLPQLTPLIQNLTAMIAANKPQIIARTQAIFAQISAQLPSIITNLGKFAGFLGALAAGVGPVVQALGGFHEVLNAIAYLMIGRLTVAIWLGVKAVWALNGAMLANPIGVVITLLGILAVAVVMVVRHWTPIKAFFAKTMGSWVASVFRAVNFIKGVFLNFTPVGLIFKHWASIGRFFSGIWDDVKAAFKVGVEAVWNILPPWFRQVLRGASFVVQAISRIGAPPSSSSSNGAGPASRPQPALGQRAALNTPAAFRGQFDFRHFYDGRPPEVTERGLSPGLNVSNIGAVGTRGG